jgi:polyketide cyclase/dehydrase/lipid transport protein
VAKLRRARTICVSIDRPVSDVYAFMSDVRRWPEWAKGLGTAPSPLSDDAWRVETAAGPMRVTFAPKNEFGVVDHVVAPLTGEGAAVDVPLRVIPNGAGSEVMLTLFQQPGMSDAQFASDASLIDADLARLKSVMEGRRK